MKLFSVISVCFLILTCGKQVVRQNPSIDTGTRKEVILTPCPEGMQRHNGGDCVDNNIINFIACCQNSNIDEFKQFELKEGAANIGVTLKAIQVGAGAKFKDSLFTTIHLKDETSKMLIAGCINKYLGVIQAPTPIPKEPRIISAVLKTETNNDNKDGNTGIYVNVYTRDKLVLIASCKSADSSDGDATEYNNGSSHTVDLNINSTEANKTQCTGFITLIKTVAHGNDKWKLRDAKVVLSFDDGSKLETSKSNFELESRNSRFSGEVSF